MKSGGSEEIQMEAKEMTIDIHDFEESLPASVTCWLTPLILQLRPNHKFPPKIWWNDSFSPFKNEKPIYINENCSMERHSKKVILYGVKKNYSKIYIFILTHNITNLSSSFSLFEPQFPGSITI